MPRELERLKAEADAKLQRLGIELDYRIEPTRGGSEASDQGQPVYLDKRDKNFPGSVKGGLLNLVMHELGHKFLTQKISDEVRRSPEFLSLFGDYHKVYKRKPGVKPNDTSFVSKYAQAHPQEDFAEVFCLYASHDGDMDAVEKDLANKSKGQHTLEQVRWLADYIGKQEAMDEAQDDDIRCPKCDHPLARRTRNTADEKMNDPSLIKCPNSWCENFSQRRQHEVEGDDRPPIYRITIKNVKQLREKSGLRPLGTQIMSTHGVGAALGGGPDAAFVDGLLKHSSAGRKIEEVTPNVPGDGKWSMFAKRRVVAERLVDLLKGGLSRMGVRNPDQYVYAAQVRWRHDKQLRHETMKWFYPKDLGESLSSVVAKIIFGESPREIIDALCRR